MSAFSEYLEVKFYFLGAECRFISVALIRGSTVLTFDISAVLHKIAILCSLTLQYSISLLQNYAEMKIASKVNCSSSSRSMPKW